MYSRLRLFELKIPSLRQIRFLVNFRFLTLTELSGYFGQKSRTFFLVLKCEMTISTYTGPNQCNEIFTQIHTYSGLV